MGRFVMIKHTVYHSTNGSIIDQNFKTWVVSNWQKAAKRDAIIRMNYEYEKLMRYIEKRRFLDETRMITLDSSSIDNEKVRAFINFREAARIIGENLMPGYLYTSVEWILTPTKFLEHDWNKDKLVLE